MTFDCFKPTPSLPKGAFQAANAIMDRGNLYILIDEYLGVSLEGIQPQGLSIVSVSQN